MPRESSSSGHVLVDVLDRVLDKGIVIDAAVRISVVGIELLGVDARVVVASIHTYLLHADTLAYTDLAAGPRRTAPVPPLYAEPVGRLESLGAGETPDVDRAAFPAEPKTPGGAAAEPAAHADPLAPDPAAEGPAEP